MKKIPENQMHNKTDDFGIILNVNKPVGKSSFAVVSYIKRLTGVKKVGHAGTLDPEASGVLLIVMGKATKQVESLMSLEKEYIGTVQFGLITDTYDSTGNILEQNSIEKLTEKSITQALTQFKGSIQQVPPRFSALKYKGKPRYSYARNGKIILPDRRPVHIYEIKLDSFHASKAIIRIVCSRGTYVRSIAHDLGQVLGCGAILSALTRMRIGEYHIDDAVSWENLPERTRELIKN